MKPNISHISWRRRAHSAPLHVPRVIIMIIKARASHIHLSFIRELSAGPILFGSHTHAGRHLQSKVYIYSLCSAHYKGKHLRRRALSHSHYNNNPTPFAPILARNGISCACFAAHYRVVVAPAPQLFPIGSGLLLVCRFFLSDIHTQVVQFPISHPGLAGEKNTHARDERA